VRKILETTKKFSELENCVASFCHGFVNVFGKKRWLNKILKIPKCGTISPYYRISWSACLHCSQNLGTFLRKGFPLPPSFLSTVGGKSRGYPNGLPCRKAQWRSDRVHRFPHFRFRSPLMQCAPIYMSMREITETCAPYLFLMDHASDNKLCVTHFWWRVYSLDQNGRQNGHTWRSCVVCMAEDSARVYPLQTIHSQFVNVSCCKTIFMPWQMQHVKKHKC